MHCQKCIRVKDCYYLCLVHAHLIQMILYLFSILLLGGGVVSQLQLQQNQCNKHSDINDNNYYIDLCEQKCECKQIAEHEFKFVCFRERENYACMPKDRRDRLHQAILDVSELSDPLYSLTKALIDRHGTGFSTIHADQYFLHFHRAYQYEFEEILRQKDCRITLPYWKFTSNPTDPFNRLPFTNDGMGDSGLYPGGTCVANGPFASWIPADKTTCLVRDFQPPVLPTITLLNTIMVASGSQFASFANQLQFSFHNGVHVTISGDSVTVLSPNDPLFFLLHGYIDKVWGMWQMLSADRMNTYPYPDDQIPFTVPHVKPSDVNSLEASLIRYVEVLTKDIHNGVLPTCGYIKCNEVCYARSRIENILLNCSSEHLYEFQQNAPKSLSPRQQKMWIGMMGTDKKSKQFIRKSLQKSASDTKSLTDSLSDITDQPLDMGFDVQSFVGRYNIQGDTYPINGKCGYVPNTEAPSKPVYLPDPTPAPSRYVYVPNPTPAPSRYIYVPDPTPAPSRPVTYVPNPTKVPSQYVYVTPAPSRSDYGTPVPSRYVYAPNPTHVPSKYVYAPNPTPVPSKYVYAPNPTPAPSRPVYIPNPTNAAPSRHVYELLPTSLPPTNRRVLDPVYTRLFPTSTTPTPSINSVRQRLNPGIVIDQTDESMLNLLTSVDGTN